VAISCTGKVWNGKCDEVENILNCPHCLGAIMEGAQVDLGVHRVPADMRKWLETDAPCFIRLLRLRLSRVMSRNEGNEQAKERQNVADRLPSQVLKLWLNGP
jgi:hypothetical protein